MVNASTSFEITQKEVKTFNIDSNNRNNLLSVSEKEKDKKYLQMKAKNKKFDIIKEEEKLRIKSIISILIPRKKIRLKQHIIITYAKVIEQIKTKMVSIYSLNIHLITSKQKKKIQITLQIM